MIREICYVIHPDGKKFDCNQNNIYGRPETIQAECYIVAGKIFAIQCNYFNQGKCNLSGKECIFGKDIPLL